MLRAVIFDMDGTLGDTLPLCVEAYQRCGQDVTGVRPEASEVTRHFGVSDRGVLGALLGMSPDDPALPMAHLVEVYERLHPEFSTAPFEGVRELLPRLRSRGLKLGLISGKEDYTAVPTLKTYGLEGAFEWLGLGKPTHNCKAERLREAMAFWHLQAQEMLYVGDAPSDITQCREVGVPIVSAGWAPGAGETEDACLALHPDYRLKHLCELEPLIVHLLS